MLRNNTLIFDEWFIIIINIIINAQAAASCSPQVSYRAVTVHRLLVVSCRGE